MIDKRIAKNSIFLYIRMFITMLIGLYTSRVVLDVLGVEDYGIYEVVGGLIALFAFLNATMAASTQRFLTFEIGRGDKERLHRVFCTAVNIHVLIGLVVVLLAESVGIWFINNKLNIPTERLTAAQIVFQCSLFTAFLSITQVPYNALIIANEKLGIYAYVSVISSVLKLLLVLLVSILSFDHLILFAVFMFIKEAIILITYRIYCVSKFKESTYKWFWDRELVVEIGAFAGWNLTAHFVNMAKNQGVNILLNIFYGPVCNAARGIASQVQGTLLQFSDNFQIAVVPQVTKRYASGDREGSIDLIIQGSKISLLLLMIVMLPIIIEAETLLSIWLVEVPEHAIIFTRLCLIATLCNAFSGLLVYGALATGRVKKYQIVMSTIIALQFCAVWILFSQGAEPRVMYIAEIVCYVVALFARLFLLKGMINFPINKYIKEVVLKSMLVIVLSFMLPYYLHTVIHSNILRVLCVGTSSVALSCAFTFFIALNKDEKQLLYRPYAILKMRWKYRKIIRTPSGTSRLFLLNIPSHGNLGDHLLSVAEQKFFKDNFPHMQIIPVTSADLYYSIKTALAPVRQNDILCVTGGGFLGSLYDEEERFLTILQMFPHNKIIVLPQTIYYEENEKGQMALERAVMYYQSHQKLYVIARDYRTFNLLRDVLMKGREDKIAFTPDLALYLNSPFKNNREGVLWCLRNDAEINDCNNRIIEELKEQVNTLGLMSEHTDTYVPYSVSYESENHEVHNKLVQFSKAQFVITDRLHGMIYSVITGTPVIALDNINGKVGQVYKQWLSNFNYVRYVPTLTQTKNLVSQMLLLKNCKYDNLELIKMYQPIIDFINAEG